MISQERIDKLRSARQVLAPPAPDVIGELLDELEKAYHIIHCLGDEWFSVLDENTMDSIEPNVPLLTFARYLNGKANGLKDAEFHIAKYSEEDKYFYDTETGVKVLCSHFKYLDPKKFPQKES